MFRKRFLSGRTTVIMPINDIFTQRHKFPSPPIWTTSTGRENKHVYPRQADDNKTFQHPQNPNIYTKGRPWLSHLENPQKGALENLPTQPEIQGEPPFQPVEAPPPSSGAPQRRPSLSIFIRRGGRKGIPSRSSRHGDRPAPDASSRCL